MLRDSLFHLLGRSWLEASAQKDLLLQHGYIYCIYYGCAVYIYIYNVCIHYIYIIYTIYIVRIYIYTLYILYIYYTYYIFTLYNIYSIYIYPIYTLYIYIYSIYIYTVYIYTIYIYTIYTIYIYTIYIYICTALLQTRANEKINPPEFPNPKPKIGFKVIFRPTGPSAFGLLSTTCQGSGVPAS